MPFVHSLLPYAILTTPPDDEEVFFHALQACGYVTAILDEFADMHPVVLLGSRKLESKAKDYVVARVRELHRLLTDKTEPPTRRAM